MADPREADNKLSIIKFKYGNNVDYKRPIINFFVGGNIYLFVSFQKNKKNEKLYADFSIKHINLFAKAASNLYSHFYILITFLKL